MRRLVAIMELLLAIVICLQAVGAVAWNEEFPVAKRGCEEKCGNLSVPFPFGMGSPNCFLDEWFEVVCNKSVTPPTLLLKRTQLEVLNISLDGGEYYSRYRYDYYGSSSNQVLLIKAPIRYYKCGDRGNQTAEVNITGAPFSFSDQNAFVAVSCGLHAKMESSSGITLSQIGCISKCPILRDNRTSCESGIGCCQTSIVSVFDSFDITFDGPTEGETISTEDQCKFAFVVDRNFWFDFLNKSTSFDIIRDMGYAPLILNWDMARYSYFDIFKRKKPERRGITSSYCYNISSYSTIKKYTWTFQCGCQYGLKGNPYLAEGCNQDVNECESKWEYCSSGGTCVNTFGGYHCSYKKKFLLIGFGSVLGALFLLFSIWVLYKKIKKRKEIKQKRKFFKQNGGLLLQQQLSSGEGNVEKTKIFDSNELDKATDHFSVDRILGQGGQGTVYKGMLEDGKIVAVKKSKIVDEEKLSEFINEVVILSQINHRNVVQLLGCCLETEVPLLVYEYIPNGTLSQYIHARNDEFPFTWKMRLRIAAEVAGALTYLHSAASFPIYHRDIKSTNILLDEKYKAKVADFGTSRTISLEQTHLTTLVYGTFGYLDPEYFQSSQFTDKSDVYSFGVVLVELLTGQRAICATRAEEGRNLATYFTMSMESNSLFDIVDAQVLENGPKEEILVVACIALRCLNLSGRNRPTMKEVSMELEGLQKSEKETHSVAQPNYEEIEFVRTELIEPWDDAASLSSSAFENTTTRSSMHQELPLLSFKSK